MRRKARVILISVVSIGLVTGLVGYILYIADLSNEFVKYPQGYSDWTHVKTMLIQEGHPLYDIFGGIHNIYINRKAQSRHSGIASPEGSVFVMDLIEAKDERHAISEGSRKMVYVMEKNSRKFASTGGWGFEGFKGNTEERAVKDPNNECFSCHEPRKNSDYIYTEHEAFK